MRRSLQNYARSKIFQVRRLVGLEKLLVIQGEIRAFQIRSSGRLASLAGAEFSVFSQWGEDGILSWLIDTIGLEDGRFVEFGVEDYRESNTRFLLMSRNWSGVVIDGSERNIASIRGDEISYKNDLQSVCSFITRDNIASLLAQAGYDGPLTLLSVDIDGVDYWVLEKITNPAKIVVIEYNQLFGDAPVSVPYDPAFRRLDKHPTGLYWGASLSAFRYLLEGRGYVFVGTNRAGTNAFFVSGDVEPKVRDALELYKEWECKMREARKPDGRLAFKRYDEMRGLVEHMPVVDVSTGEERRIRDLPR